MPLILKKELLKEQYCRLQGSEFWKCQTANYKKDIYYKLTIIFFLYSWNLDTDQSGNYSFSLYSLAAVELMNYCCGYGVK